MSADTLKAASHACEEVEPKPSSPDVDLISPQSKRMKQGRLAFKPLTQKTLSPVQSVAKECKKRKLSDPDNPTAKQPKSVKPQPLNKATAKPENDNEVSSSSEADLHGSASMPKPVSRKTLERFVSSVRKEEDITSTNDVIDLTDVNNVDIDEPMEVDCNKENESEIIVLDETTKFIDNCSKIIDIVASGKYEVKEKKPHSPCNKKPEKSNSPSSASNIQVLLLKSKSVKKTETSEIEISHKHNLQTDKDSISLIAKSETQNNADKTLPSGESISNESPAVQSKDSFSRPMNSFEKNSVAASAKVTLCSEIDRPNSDPKSDDSLEPETAEIEETKASSAADVSDSPESSMDDSVLELSSSVISPQTADDSFKRITSAGSTPRTSKPRSKVSSAKKAEREALRQKRKEQKEKEMQEKKRLKDEAKMEKERIRKEEKDRKEKERTQKEQEKQQKREQLEMEKLERQQQREEEKKKKQEFVDAKLEEKRKKEEERRLIEEEKRLKEEEKQREEDERLNKKKKMQDKFQSFFTKSKSGPPAQKTEMDQAVGRFMPFEVKKDMSLAPQNFCLISEESKGNLDQLLYSQDCNELYISKLKSGVQKPKSWSKDKDRYESEELMVLEHDSEVVKKVTYHVKLLQFHTNYRPPYYGTWRKKSKVISPRNPWKTDGDLLDYEVDSDDEWEEEEPGESLSASEGEDEKDVDKDGEKDDDEEEEDGWLVPHGYLSEDEGCVEDEEVTPEMLKARQTAKLVQWEREQQRQCQPQRAVVSGCFWVSTDTTHPQDTYTMLAQFKAVLCTDPERSIPTSHTRVEKARVDGGSVQDGLDKQGDTPSSKGQMKKPVPEEAMPDLVRLVHGNPSGIKRLVEEFRLFWARKNSQSTGDGAKVDGKVEAMDVDEPQASSAVPYPGSTLNDSEAAGTPGKLEDEKDECKISKRQMEIRISAIAVREKRSLCKKVCWYVHDSILQQYNLTQLPVPCEWQYLTIPNKKETAENQNTAARKTPTSKMFATGSPAQTFTSPAEVKDKPDQTKRPSDQRSITFFTKAKDAIMKTKAPETTVTIVEVHSVPSENESKAFSTQIEPIEKIQPSGHIEKELNLTTTAKLSVLSSQLDSENSAVLSSEPDQIETLSTTENKTPEIICLD